MKINWLILACGFFVTSVYAEDKLIFALDLVRHGARTPCVDIKIPNYDWPEGLGQLTPAGMQQMYQLGLIKRKIYVEQYHLLPATYQVNTIYVRSTDYDRALMSAQSFLLGFYPLGTGPILADSTPALPFQFQPVPIHSVTPKDDQLFTPLSWIARNVLLHQYVFTEKSWRDKQAALAPKFPAWSAATGLDIKNLSQLIVLGDALYVRASNHVVMPPNLSDAEIKLIIDTGSWALAKYYQPHVIAHAAAHNLLMQLDLYLILASRQQSPIKYVLWSAHDTTLLALLSDLYAPLSEQVPYGSDINFMLFENEQQQYFVKVTYNDKPVHIPACHQSNVCSLAQFLAIDRPVY